MVVAECYIQTCTGIVVKVDNMACPTVVHWCYFGNRCKCTLVVRVIHHANLYAGIIVVVACAVRVETNCHSLHTVYIEHWHDDKGMVVGQISVRAQLQRPVAAAVVAVPDAWTTVVHHRTAPSGGHSVGGIAVELLAVWEGDVGLEGMGTEARESAMLRHRLAVAVYDELVGGVGNQPIDGVMI